MRGCIDPPEVILGESVEPAGVPVGEFQTPATFDNFDLDIHCGACDGIYSSYWGWYDHASEEFDDLDKAQDMATVLVFESEDFEEAIGFGRSEGPTIETPASGKPSPSEVFGGEE